MATYVIIYTNYLFKYTRLTIIKAITHNTGEVKYALKLQMQIMQNTSRPKSKTSEIISGLILVLHMFAI